MFMKSAMPTAVLVICLLTGCAVFSQFGRAGGRTHKASSVSVRALSASEAASAAAAGEGLQIPRSFWLPTGWTVKFTVHYKNKDPIAWFVTCNIDEDAKKLLDEKHDPHFCEVRSPGRTVLHKQYRDEIRMISPIRQAKENETENKKERGGGIWLSLRDYFWPRAQPSEQEIFWMTDAFLCEDPPSFDSPPKAVVEHCVFSVHDPNGEDRTDLLNGKPLGFKL